MAFGAPLLLLGLATLPIIWWLLRLTPPRPNHEIFPPLELLARVVKQEETPAKSPWWLTLLRLTMAALVIVALARPIVNPQSAPLSNDGPLLIMLDNGWAHPGQWETRKRQATMLARSAGDNGRPIAVALTVMAETAPVAMGTVEDALSIIDAAAPIAAQPDRVAAWDKLMIALDGRDTTTADLAIISDGLAHARPVSDSDDAADSQALAERLSQMPPATILLYGHSADSVPLAALTDAFNGSDTLDLAIAQTAPFDDPLTVTAYDERARPLAQTQPIQIDDENGESRLVARFTEPFELRNDFSWLSIDGARHAGAVRLLDDSDRRRRAGLVTGLSGDNAQPLLSPLFYIRRAIEPFTDIIEARTGDMSIDIPEILEQGPALLVMADIGVIPASVAEPLNDWINAGGTLVRFAGPRLAALSDTDPFLPVELRLGERSLTGALSWTEPQPVAPFPQNSPFADLDAPNDVSVERQVLADPDPELNARTWAILADGTPLVTGTSRGRGSIVLFHVTAEATWSNLPISGTFVEMLQRISDRASNTGTSADSIAALSSDTNLVPARILSSDGLLQPPGPQVEPVNARMAALSATSHENPAGLYGTSDSFAALNAANGDTALAPLILDDLPASDVQRLAYSDAAQSNLAKWLFAAALFLFFIDTLAVLWINGKFTRRPAPKVATTMMALAFAAAFFTAIPQHAVAQDNTAEDTLIDAQTAIELSDVTRIAYVITATPTDEITRAGLDGLSRFIESRTALEPGTPVGVNLETDELAFFPLIYFAIDASAKLPSPTAMARLDAYMQNGGTVLFDTRDDLVGEIEGGQTAENSYLREMLSSLNVPPLEPVPSVHVLTKSFYILDYFPGRYAGSPLWVAASLADERADRPVRTGDGVSPIMITGNDFAAAWALDEAGRPLEPVSTGDPLQRIYAFRTGVNIMMYMLTGNYKADQVHIPALLERLGQ